jgi:hypothetical protein
MKWAFWKMMPMFLTSEFVFGVLGKLGQVGISDHHFPFFGREQAAKEVQERRFAAAGLPEQQPLFALLAVDVVELELLLGVVGECQVFGL